MPHSAVALASGQRQFETLHFGLNLLDDSFQELGPSLPNQNLSYYNKRETMLNRRMEINDKLKAVQLLEAFNVDDGFKRDILSKIDFKKEP